MTTSMNASPQNASADQVQIETPSTSFPQADAVEDDDEFDVDKTLANLFAATRSFRRAEVDDTLDSEAKRNDSETIPK